MPSTPLEPPTWVFEGSDEGGLVVATGLMSSTGVLEDSEEDGASIVKYLVSSRSCWMSAATPQSLVMVVPRAAEVEASGASISGETS
jgi:hypothetical protein